MTQAEKTMLRYQYVMAHASATMGDFSDTSGTWSNQVRLLTQNLQNLGKTIGGIAISAFRPMLISINQIILKLSELAVAVSNSLGKIFGWKYEEGSGGMADVTDRLDDMTDGFEDANSSAKKLKQTLAGFDELNNTTSSDSSSSGGGLSSGSGGYQQSQWIKTDSIFKDFESDLDSLYKLGDAISNKLSEVLRDIDWNKIYSKASNFGSGLAEFLNGLINPRLFSFIGETIASSLNTAVSGALSFAKTFDWENFGESLATSFSTFIRTWDAGITAEMLSTFASGLLRASTEAIKTNMTQDTFNDIGQKIADFICGIDWKGLKYDFTKFYIALSEAIIDFPADFLEGFWTELLVHLFGKFNVDEEVVRSGLKHVGFGEKIRSVLTKITPSLIPPTLSIPIKVIDFFKSDENDWKNFGLNIFLGITTGFHSGFPTISLVVKEFFDTIFQKIKEKFGIESPAKKMYPLGNNIMLGIVSGFNEKIVAFNKAISDWFNTVKPWFAKAKWNSVLTGFKDAFKEKFNAVIGFAEKMANCVADAVNIMIDGINKLSFEAPDWVPFAGGKTVGFNLNKFEHVSIPRLAEGAVIRPNNEFLALLGDQKRGTNIEAPLDTIVQAFEVTEGNSNRESNELLRQILQAVIDKETGIRKSELFESVRRSAREYQSATGRFAF